MVPVPSTRRPTPPDADSFRRPDPIHHYTLFGLVLESEARLPRLEPAGGPVDGPVVRLSLAAYRHGGTSPEPGWRLILPRTPAPDTEPTVRVWHHDATGSYRFRYQDGATFEVDGAGRSIRASHPSDMPIEDVSSYLLGPVIAFVLRQRGTVCLHASAVRCNDGALAFLGHAHAGKSTLAAAFSLAGHQVISDDIVTLEHAADQRFHVAPDVPFLGLWPTSAELLFGDAQALPAMSETWDKRVLDVRQHAGTADRPVPLAAAYVLAPRSDAAELGPTGIAIRPLGGHYAVTTLVAHARAVDLLGPDERLKELDVMSDVVRSVPIHAVDRASEVTPQAVRDAIVAHREAASGSHGAP